MARVYDRIDDHHRAWIARQSMFFVATAPLAESGHVNVSPKGPIGSLRVIDDHTLAYLDISGSGAETIAHVRENGRIVVMLCAFDGPPRIMRFHGRGTVVFPDEARYAELAERFAFEDLSIPEARRALIVVDVSRVSDSCGYGVPLMSFEGHRDHHRLSSEKQLRVKGIDGYAEHRRTKNRESLDGLPAVDIEHPLEAGLH
jgi:predicted pyridoxine 5'-phosphate oxidase superfamily flavin-nucleotide-binding protein